MMSSLPKAFERYIQEQRLLAPGDKILLAVSGGVDSMALMDLFFGIHLQWNLRLAAVHIQHGIRGADAVEDENFVGNACHRYGIPFWTVETNAPRYARLKKMSLETGARELRYAFFNSILERSAFDRVAIAHHADDQAETILLNLVRGSGLKGLGGMLPSRGKYIRPLLFASREDIEGYVQKRSLDFRTDKTNLDRQFRRNRMRWSFLADLKQNFGKSVSTNICRAGLAATEAEQVLEYEALKGIRRTINQSRQDEITLDIKLFLSYFKGIQKVILMQLFQSVPFIQKRPSYYELERILRLIRNGKSGAVLELTDGVSIIKTGNHLVWRRKTVRSNAVYPVEIGRCIELTEIGIRISTEIVERSSHSELKRGPSTTVFLDYDAVHPPLLLRFPMPGDWFIPLGMKRKKKLRDFFMDAKVPNYSRRQIPLFLSKDIIAWVCGLRLDERFKVTDKTKRLLKLEMNQI